MSTLQVNYCTTPLRHRDGASVENSSSLQQSKNNLAALNKFNIDINELIAQEENILSHIPELLDEEIVTIRNNAQKLGAFHWRIEIACDAEIWRRERFRGGPGKTDVTGSGITPAVAKRAKQVGVTPKTIRLNSRIHQTFSEVLNTSVQVLPDKKYYIVALQSSNPHETLKEFMQLKQTNAKFSTNDALKLITSRRKETVTQNQGVVEGARTDDRKSIEQHLHWALTKIDEMIAACPDPHIAKVLYLPFKQDVKDQLDTMFIEDAAAALRKAWDLGCKREDQLTQRTGLSRDRVSQVMNMLADEGEFCLIEQRGETDRAKGGHTKLWHKTGQPLGNDYYVKPRQ